MHTPNVACKIANKQSLCFSSDMRIGTTTSAECYALLHEISRSGRLRWQGDFRQTYSLFQMEKDETIAMIVELKVVSFE